MKQFQDPIRMLPLAIHACGMVTVVLAALGYYYVVHAPLRSRADADGLRSQQLTGLLEGSKRSIHTHRQVHDQLREVSAAVERVRSHLPMNPEEGQFLAEAGKIADAEGLQIIDYRRGAAMAHPTHSHIELGLKCIGDYDGLCRFVDQLEKNPRISSVQEFTLQVVPGHEKLPFEIRFLLYYGLHKTPVASTGVLSPGADS